MKTTRVEIKLEALLRALEEGRHNPNCYEETGKIRAKFRSFNSDRVILLESDSVSIIQEQVTTF